MTDPKAQSTDLDRQMSGDSYTADALIHRKAVGDLIGNWPFSSDQNQYVGSRHHIVPRFYLEGWTNADEKLVVVEKPGGRRYPTGPKTAGAETDFYTIPQDKTAEQYGGGFQRIGFGRMRRASCQ